MKPLVFSTVLAFLAFLSTSCYSVMNASLDAAYIQSSGDQPASNDNDATDDSSAPQPKDTVYLKDGSIIHGQVIEEVPGASLKIKTVSGNVYTYPMASIAKITHQGYSQQDVEDATGPGDASSNDGAMDKGSQDP